MFDWARKLFGAADWPRRDSTTDPDFRTLGDFQNYPASTYSLANKVSIAYSCINLILCKLVPLPRGVRRNGVEIDHPLTDLLAQPYSRLDGFQGWQYPLRGLLTQGNGYFVVKRSRGNGRAVELIPAIEGGAQYAPNGGVEYTLSTIHEGQVARAISGHMRPRISSRCIGWASTA